MGETTQGERDEIRLIVDENLRREFQIVPIPSDVVVRAMNDADRLAAIEARVRELADELFEQNWGTGGEGERVAGTCYRRLHQILDSQENQCDTTT